MSRILSDPMLSSTNADVAKLTNMANQLVKDAQNTDPAGTPLSPFVVQFSPNSILNTLDANLQK